MSARAGQALCAAAAARKENAPAEHGVCLARRHLAGKMAEQGRNDAPASAHRNTQRRRGAADAAPGQRPPRTRPPRAGRGSARTCSAARWMTPSGFSAASAPTKDSSSIFACTMPMRAISSSDIVSDRRPCVGGERGAERGGGRGREDGESRDGEDAFARKATPLPHPHRVEDRVDNGDARIATQQPRADPCAEEAAAARDDAVRVAAGGGEERERERERAVAREPEVRAQW